MVLLTEAEGMIKYKKGNILNENVDAIVNTVNCVGIMGRGIALQLKKNFPKNFKAYALACKRGEVRPGRMFVYETDEGTNPRFIINFPTKRHWRSKSQIQDIQKGLLALVDEIQVRNIKSIAIPPLGSGLGGLNWIEVRECIDKALSDLEHVDIIIFEPNSNVPAFHGKDELKSPPKMTAGRAALISLIDRYLNGLMVPFITLLEVHKLMYFMQEAGEPLRLNFQKALYGPYAENLRHVLHAIEGIYINGYSDGGDQPSKKLELSHGALPAMQSFFETHKSSTTCSHVEKVANLFDGFETPLGLELLSTVHWVVKNEHAESVEDTIGKVHSWNPKKKQFTERQIKIAYEILQQKNWIRKSVILGKE